MTAAIVPIRRRKKEEVVETPRVVDIYADHRARVKAKDWDAVHLAGDANEPVDLWPRRWRKAGEATRVERGGFVDG